MEALEGRGPATPVVIGPLRVEAILKRGREGELAGKDRSSGAYEKKHLRTEQGIHSRIHRSYGWRDHRTR